MITIAISTIAAMIIGVHGMRSLYLLSQKSAPSSDTRYIIEVDTPTVDPGCPNSWVGADEKPQHSPVAPSGFVIHALHVGSLSQLAWQLYCKPPVVKVSGIPGSAVNDDGPAGNALPYVNQPPGAPVLSGLNAHGPGVTPLAELIPSFVLATSQPDLIGTGGPGGGPTGVIGCGFGRGVTGLNRSIFGRGAHLPLTQIVSPEQSALVLQEPRSERAHNTTTVMITRSRMMIPTTNGVMTAALVAYKFAPTLDRRG